MRATTLEEARGTTTAGTVGVSALPSTAPCCSFVWAGQRSMADVGCTCKQ